MTTSRLRKLLEAYYGGTTTPQEEQMLREYFAQAADVPAEFRIDAAMFKAMSYIEETHMPDDLEQRILATTVEKPSRPALIRWLPYAGVAAAVAVILTLCVRLMHHTPAEELPQAPVLALNIATPVPEEPAVVYPVRLVRPVPPSTATTCTEVTDPDEATRIVEEVLDMLARQMGDTGSEGVKKVEMAIAMAENPADVLEIQSRYQ